MTRRNQSSLLPYAREIKNIPLLGPLAGKLIRIVVRKVRRFGFFQWGTKSFEFWTLLMVMLSTIRPKSMVELGGGRSTSYFAEYALKESVPYVSIEESRSFVRLVRRGMKSSFLADAFIHHGPRDRDGWYRQSVIDRLVDFQPDLLFVDGPIRDRTVPRAVSWISGAAKNARLLIVDDVHWRSVHGLFHSLIQKMPTLAIFYLAYYPQPNRENVVAVAMPKHYHEKIVRLCKEIGIPIFFDYPVERCSEP